MTCFLDTMRLYYAWNQEDDLTHHNGDIKMHDQVMSLYGLSSPSQDIIDERTRKVEAVKATMGDKYLLAKPVGRKK